MTTRFWVGDAGRWDDARNWSTSPGGTGGAGVPVAEDDIVLTAAERPQQPE